jgi:CRP/FNR family transcriptional regulator
MNVHDRREIDCGKCVSAARCWQEHLPIDSGLSVRRLRPLEAGEFLFHQGEAFEAPFIVTSGCIALPETLPNGDERIAAFLVPGEIIGLESWAGGTHLHGAQAVRAATVCRLKWSSRAPTHALMKPLLAKLGRQLDRATRPWAGLTAVDRVAAFVSDFEQRAGMAPPMTRLQIGLHLGLAEETVVRALARSRNRQAKSLHAG